MRRRKHCFLVIDGCITVNITFFPFMVHVKLADGYDFPTVHTALKPSVLLTSFLSMCKFGSSMGSSTTCIRDSLMSVWKVGASSDTSQRNMPDTSRLTLRNVNVCESDVATCKRGYTVRIWNSTYWISAMGLRARQEEKWNRKEMGSRDILFVPVCSHRAGCKIVCLCGGNTRMPINIFLLLLEIVPRVNTDVAAHRTTSERYPMAATAAPPTKGRLTETTYLCNAMTVVSWFIPFSQGDGGGPKNE